MISLELAGRIQRGSRIILGTGLQLDQDDDGATILSVAPGISSIGVQDANSGPDTAARLVFQGNVVSVDPATGIATFDLDGRYQLKPAAGYSWVAGSSFNTFATPYGAIQLGPANSSYAHIYSTLPFYFNQQISVLGSTVWHSGNDGPGSDLNADLLDGQHGAYYQPASAVLASINQNLGTGNSPTFADLTLSGRLLLGTFATGANAGEARVGRGSDRAVGTITNQLGGAAGGAAVWVLIDRAYTKAIVQFDGRAPAGAIFMDSAGKVGFGTSTPAYQVDVAGDVRATGWFRNDTDGFGLYNQASNYYWFADGNKTRWVSRSGSGIELMNTAGTRSMGYLYFIDTGLQSTSKFGLLNAAGSWSVQCNGNGPGGVLYGDWSITGLAYATRFIDADNVGFYLDPASTSNLNGATFANLVSILNTSGPGLSFGAATRQMIDLWSDGTHQHGIGVQASTTYQRTSGGYAWFRGGAHSNTQNDPGPGGAVLMTLSTLGDLAGIRGLTVGTAGIVTTGGINVDGKITTTSSVPLTMDIAAGGNRYPYIEWKYGGVRGAYMGWGTPGTQLDLTLEAGNKLAINGIVDVVGILRNNGNPVTPTVASTDPPGNISIYPEGTLFVEYVA